MPLTTAEDSSCGRANNGGQHAKNAQTKGVTHRDIKPGNIMLTKNGSKLLDFGLAKLKQEAARPAVPLSQLPTLSKNPTVEGTILGTLQYMAPEQVEGKVDEIDARTDVFSFGAVVYEMATGKKAFQGKSAASLIGAILKDGPRCVARAEVDRRGWLAGRHTGARCHHPQRSAEQCPCGVVRRGCLGGRGAIFGRLDIFPERAGRATGCSVFGWPAGGSELPR